MKKFWISLLFIGIGIVSINHFARMEEEDDDAFTAKITQTYEEQVADNNVRDMVNKAKSLEDLAKAESAMNALPKEYCDRIEPTITLKRAALYFNEAEEYLRKAAEIENAVLSVGPQPPPPPPDPENPENPDHPEQIQPPAPAPRELHPLTLINFNKALNLYEKARKESEKLKDTGRADFDYHLNYLKGEIYYRILEFMAEPDSVQEIFNQTLTYYKYALRNRNSDINTIVNIELLIKNQNSLLANASNPQGKKRQALAGKRYGVGRSSGN